MVGNRLNSMRLVFGDFQALVTCPTGASHIEKGQPCQDACMVAQHYYSGIPYMVLAVADGHGSQKYTRSDVGAHLAVEAAGNAATDLVMTLTSLRKSNPDNWHKQAKHEVNSRLGKRVLQYWYSKVVEHGKNYPEEGLVEGTDGFYQRYGSTIALALLYDNLLITAKLGDSAIYMVVKEDNKLTVRKVSASSNEENVGFATDSLISLVANYRWNFEIISMADKTTTYEMIMLTTDGFIDSLDDPERTIVDICKKTKSNGIEWLEKSLPKHLAYWSYNGAGDDMGCIVLFPSLNKYSSDLTDDNSPNLQSDSDNTKEEKKSIPGDKDV